MKILLVDDDELCCTMVDRLLSKQGHDIIVAHDGDDALHKLQQHKFDLIVTDIMMPNKEGIEVIQEIKNIDPNIKIIAISSGGRAGYTSFLQLAETVGADASLKKPFQPGQLIDKLNELMTGTE